MGRRSCHATLPLTSTGTGRGGKSGSGGDTATDNEIMAPAAMIAQPDASSCFACIAATVCAIRGFGMTDLLAPTRVRPKRNRPRLGASRAGIGKDGGVYDVGAVHGPNRWRAAVVLRKYIGVVVAVEISRVGDMPGGSRIGQCCSMAEVGAVHDPHRDQTGRAGRLNDGADNTDCTVAVQVLMETGLERLQRRARHKGGL